MQYLFISSLKQKLFLKKVSLFLVLSLFLLNYSFLFFMSLTPEASLNSVHIWTANGTLSCELDLWTDQRCFGPPCCQPAFSLGTSQVHVWKSFSLEFIVDLFWRGTCSLLLGEMVSDVYTWILTFWSWIREGIQISAFSTYLIPACCHLLGCLLPGSPEHFWFHVCRYSPLSNEGAM